MRKFFLWVSMCIVAAASVVCAGAADTGTATAPAVRTLRQILMAESPDAAQKLEVDPARGFLVLSPALSSLNADELRKKLAAGENRAIDDQLLAAIAQVVERFLRENGHPTATAVIPPQNIAPGGVRIVVSLVNHPLKQIVLSPQLEAATGATAASAATTSPDGGFVSLPASLSFFNAAELTKRLEGGRGRMIDETLLAAIKEVIGNFAHEQGLPAATATIPPQDFADGIVRVTISIGKIRNIQVEGNRWFSDSLLREKLRIDRGTPLRMSELDRAIGWANTSPYRHIKLHIDPVPNTGEADLVIKVTDRVPLRATLGYENSGNAFTGTDRYSASLSYGNLWGRDHQLTYHFATTNEFSTLQVHALDYRAPLPWRHTFALSGSYVRTNPSLLNGDFTQKGKSINGDGRYIVPFKTKRWLGEISAGVSYKQTNNNLEFGVVPVSADTLELLTATVGAAALREDLRGKWIASLNFTGSPGEILPGSTAYNFNVSRQAAATRFLHTQLLLQRNTIVAPGVTSMTRAFVQFASSNLVPSEEFALGGASSVRGYEDRVIYGDGGYTLTHELHKRLPALPLGKRLSKLDLIGVVFLDYGRAIIKHPLTYVDTLGNIVGQQTKAQYLASVGLGLRTYFATNLAASIDVGRQLEEVEIPGAAHHRVHVKVSLAY